MAPESKSHGVPYMEPPRHDELPDGTPDALQERASAERKSGGARIPKGATAITAAGGRALKSTTRLSHRIDSPSLTETSQRRARVLRKALSTEISSTVGGGQCGVAASLFLKFAAMKTAASEEAFDRGDFEAHRRLTESARMDVLYAREHAAKTAAARAETSATGWPGIPAKGPR